jgi:hypothetical protein
MTRTICIVTILASAGAGVAPAQSPEGLSVGQRVRITRSSQEPPLVGSLYQVDDRQLVIDDGKGAFTSVPTADVRKIELTMGKRSNVVRGAIIGASIGVALGVTAVVALCDDNDCINEGGAIAVLGLGGGALGAIVGAPIRTERWQSVPLDGVRSRVDGPRSQLAVTLRF